MSASRRSGVDALARAAASASSRVMDSWWGWATVTQVSPLRIRLDTELTALDVTPENLAGALAVDDRVWVQVHGRQIIVHAITGGPSALVAATPDPTPDTLVLRDGAGRAQVVDPSADEDIDTKGARDAALVGTWTLLASLTRTATQSVSSGAGNGYRVVWTAADYDPLSIYSTTNITIPTTGIYRFVFTFSLQANTGGTYRIVFFHVGGADLTTGGGFMSPPTGATLRASLVTTVPLTAGNVVSYLIQQDSGSSLTLGTSYPCRLTVERLNQ